jgi:hypothetical protein
MFSKLFDSMFDGTLRTRAPWQALVTFQQMLILCDPTGVCDMTPEAIAFRTGIPSEIIQTGIAALEAPDPDSRLPNDEGRRIVRLDDHRNWGWRITNFLHYRSLQSNEARREYQREWLRNQRAAKKGAVDRVGVPTPDDTYRQAMTADDDVDTRIPRVTSKTIGQPDGFQDFWDAYPKKVKKKDARKVWARLKPDERLQSTIHAALATHKRKWDTGTFIPDPTTWLNGERWEDELGAQVACSDGQKMRAAL